MSSPCLKPPPYDHHVALARSHGTPWEIRPQDSSSPSRRKCNSSKSLSSDASGSRYKGLVETIPGSALAPTESPNILASHTCSQTLLSTFTSSLSVRTVCVPMGWHRERVHVHLTNSRSIRLKPGISQDRCRSSSAPAPLNEFSHGGYAGVRLGEARNPGPATHERDRTAEERIDRQRRNNEAGRPSARQPGPHHA